MDFRDAPVIARGQAVENFRQPHARAAVDPAHDPEVDRGDRAVRFHEQIALVHIGMEKARSDRLLEESQHQPVGELGCIVPGRADRFCVADLDSVDPVDGHDPAIGAVPVDPGYFVALGADHVLGQLRRACRLAAQVELAIGPALEIGNHQPRAQAHGFAAHRLDMRCSPLVGLDIARELFAHTRAQHLDRDLPAIGRDGAVNLRDRGRADGHRVEFAIEVLQRLLEARFDAGADLVEAYRGQVVLQGQQIADRILADEVGPRGQRLPQLDRGGADVAKGARIVGLLRLHRAEAGNPGKPFDRRGRIGVALDPAQRAVPRQCAAPFEKPPDMRRRTSQVARPSTPNGC